jgi:PIN domain nuclease of toxin-antitoxin system
VRKRRLELSLAPLAWFDAAVAASNLQLAAINAPILAASGTLPDPAPNDPADRIFIATAQALGLTLVTRDKVILDYAMPGQVAVLPC